MQKNALFKQKRCFLVIVMCLAIVPLHGYIIFRNHFLHDRKESFEELARHPSTGNNALLADLIQKYCPSIKSVTFPNILKKDRNAVFFNYSVNVFEPFAFPIETKFEGFQFELNKEKNQSIDLKDFIKVEGIKCDFYLSKKCQSSFIEDVQIFCLKKRQSKDQIFIFSKGKSH